MRKVLIAGAGVGALEALLALRSLAPRSLQIDVLAPGESFLCRPVSIAETLSEREPAAIDLDALLRDQRVRRHVDSLASVDAAQRIVHTRSGAAHHYDELIVATGPRLVTALRGALALRGRADVPAARATLRELEEGRLGSLACVLPVDSRAWPIPIYELALSVAASAPAAAISLVTPEPRPLAALGAPAGRAVAKMLAARGVALRTQAEAVAFEGGVLRLADGRTVGADRVIALPRLCGPAIDGLPADGEGFLPIDGHGRVEGVDAVYAAGDVTDFPIKLGALAAAQADSIAHVIAARSGAATATAPFRPLARGLLLAGEEPLYVRVASDRAHSAPGGVRRPEQGWPEGALWWPFSRSVGRYLAPLLAAAGGSRARRFEARTSDSVALWLALADHDARAGDPAMALDALAHAEALGGSRPASIAAKRAALQALVEADEPVGSAST